MQTTVNRAYTTRDYMLDGNGKLRRWTCRWNFIVRAEGEGFVYRASSDSAPGGTASHTHERQVSADEAAALVSSIKANLDTCPLFTRADE